MHCKATLEKAEISLLGTSLRGWRMSIEIEGYGDLNNVNLFAFGISMMQKKVCNNDLLVFATIFLKNILI